MPDNGQSKPHSNALRIGRVDMPHHIYHVVKCLNLNLRKSISLCHSEVAEIIVNALVYQRDNFICRLFAFVVMPDHVHWLFSLPENDGLSKRVKVFFNWSARQINLKLGRHGALWQSGYYDHLVRENETLKELIRYIESNPMRKDLCENYRDWLWSSAHPRWEDKLDRNWLGRNRFD